MHGREVREMLQQGHESLDEAEICLAQSNNIGALIQTVYAEYFLCRIVQRNKHLTGVTGVRDLEQRLELQWCRLGWKMRLLAWLLR